MIYTVLSICTVALIFVCCCLFGCIIKSKQTNRTRNLNPNRNKRINIIKSTNHRCHTNHHTDGFTDWQETHPNGTYTEYQNSEHFLIHAANNLKQLRDNQDNDVERQNLHHCTCDSGFGSGGADERSDRDCAIEYGNCHNEVINDRNADDSRDPDGDCNRGSDACDASGGNDDSGGCNDTSGGNDDSGGCNDTSGGCDDGGGCNDAGGSND